MSGKARRQARLVASFSACLICMLATEACAQNSGQAPYVHWLNNLPAGWTVTKGTAVTFPGCGDFINTFSSCFGNNAVTPYILTSPPEDTTNSLPSWATANGSGYVYTLGGGITTDDFWQISNDEAIVTIITMPPQAGYFGFETYLAERSALVYGGAGGTSCTGGAASGASTLAPDCNYVIFDNFTNAVNNADVLNLAGISPWNTYNDSMNPPAQTFNTIAIISTSDQALETTLAGYFKGTGYIFADEMPATSQPTDPPSAPVLNTCTGGVTMPCDVFVSVIRLTLPEHSADEATWEGGVGGVAPAAGSQVPNVLVYRVKQPSGSTITLYDAGDVVKGNTTNHVVGLYQQGCNNNETGYTPSPGTIGPGAGCNTPVSAAAFSADLTDIAYWLQQWANTHTDGDTYDVHPYSGASSNNGVKATSTTGGVGSCIYLGTNCAGPTQDNSFYRTVNIGKLKDISVLGTTTYYYPVFTVGVVHSSSQSDFTPPPTPLNNADYTGMSIADNASMYSNTGVADAANPNSSSEYTINKPNDFLLGSAYTVLNNLYDQNTTLWSHLQKTTQEDINDLYIHVFYREDSFYQNNAPACDSDVCSNNLTNDRTIIGAPQAGQPPSANPTLIPDADVVKFTERQYLLAPPPNTNPSVNIPQQYLTGAAVQFLQGPLIVCDLSITCPSQ
jgi:hypothetical protein